MIDPNEIHVGDIVRVDDGGSSVRGEVALFQERFYIWAFGVRIPVARLNTMGRMVPMPHSRITEHQPQLGVLS